MTAHRVESPLEALDRWVDAGHVTPEQAAAIRAEEAVPPPEASPAASRDGAGRSRIAEALGYVGAALAVGAAGLLLVQLWRDLLPWARLTLVGAMTLAVLGAAWALRRTQESAMRRLTNVLLTAGVVGVAWFVGLVARDHLGASEETTALGAAGAALLVAAVCVRWRGGVLLQLAAIVAGVATAITALLQPALTPEPQWFGLVIGTVGLVWTLLAAGAWVLPRRVGEVFGALTVLIGVLVAAVSDVRTLVLALGVAGAAGLVALALARDALHHLVVAALAFLVLVPQLVFELFGEAIGAPATLLLIGLLLVLGAVGLGRARREVVPERQEADDGR